MRTGATDRTVRVKGLLADTPVCHEPLTEERLPMLFLVLTLLLDILVGAAAYLARPVAVVLGAAQPLAPQRPCRVEHAFARMKGWEILRDCRLNAPCEARHRASPQCRPRWMTEGPDAGLADSALRSLRDSL
jgi:hypothetical protein